MRGAILSGRKVPRRASTQAMAVAQEAVVFMREYDMAAWRKWLLT